MYHNGIAAFIIGKQDERALPEKFHPQAYAKVKEN
jgi:hypothetical protein